MLFHYLVCYLRDQSFPIRRWYWSLVRHCLTVVRSLANSNLGQYLERTSVHEPPRTSAKPAEDSFHCPSLSSCLGPPLLASFPHAQLFQHFADIVVRRRSYSDQERPRPDRGDDVGRTVCQQDQSQIGAVFLHCSPQRRLCISGKMIRFIDNHDLEPLPCGLIHLLCLRHFL